MQFSVFFACFQTWDNVGQCVGCLIKSCDGKGTKIFVPVYVFVCASVCSELKITCAHK